MVKTTIAFRQAPWPVRFRLKLKGMRQALHFRIHVPGLNADLSLPRSHWSCARRTAFRRPVGGLSQLGEEYHVLHQSDLYPGCLPCCVPFDLACSSTMQQPSDRWPKPLLKYVNLFTFPVIALFAALIPEFVAVFYTNKWLPALPAFYFLLGAHDRFKHHDALRQCAECSRPGYARRCRS
jgi:hypothetical protein